MPPTDPRHLRIDDYTYDLPEARIAKHPPAERDAARLLCYRSGAIEQDVFRNLPRYVPGGTLMVFNDTKVIRARLHFRKATGARVEIFCLEPLAPAEYEENFAARGSVVWSCLVGGLKKWKEGALQRTLRVGERDVVLTAVRGAASGAGYAVTLSWDASDMTFAEILDAIGELPIPPYLKRPTEAADRTDYQTVYGRVLGSVAAPTAGLHFTPGVLKALEAQGVEHAKVTLHVGAGTFKPVKSDEMGDHAMHAEWFSVSRRTVEQLLRHDATCLAVGTTSVRTLESLYYLGVRLHREPTLEPDELHVAQWTPYDTPADLPPREALEAVLRWLDSHELPALHASTRLIIAPGYRFHFVSAMLTNFHQPRSTLLLLVSAFVGEDWRRIYAYALDHDFRFLSYGDASLLVP